MASCAIVHADLSLRYTSLLLGSLASEQPTVYQQTPLYLLVRYTCCTLIRLSDEGFIEITVDPSKPVEDDLFPASIFAKETSAQVNPPQASRDSNNSAAHDDNDDDNDNDDDGEGDGGDIRLGVDARLRQPVEVVDSDGEVRSQPVDEVDPDEKGRSRSGNQSEAGDDSVDRSASRLSSVEENMESEAVREADASMASPNNADSSFAKGVNSLVNNIFV